jgi:hypothetical protein
VNDARVEATPAFRGGKSSPVRRESYIILAVREKTMKRTVLRCWKNSFLVTRIYSGRAWR